MYSECVKRLTALCRHLDLVLSGVGLCTNVKDFYDSVVNKGADVSLPVFIKLLLAGTSFTVRCVHMHRTSVCTM